MARRTRKVVSFDKRYKQERGTTAEYDRICRRFRREWEEVGGVGHDMMGDALVLLTHPDLEAARSLEKRGMKTGHSIALINKDGDLYVAFYESLPYNLGMMASRGEGIPVFARSCLGGFDMVAMMVGKPDIMVVRGIFGPLDKKLMEKNAGKKGSIAKFDGQPYVPGPGANAVYSGLWSGTEAVFHTDQDIFETQGWIEALQAWDEKRLERLWDSVRED